MDYFYIYLIFGTIITIIAIKLLLDLDNYLKVKKFLKNNNELREAQLFILASRNHIAISENGYIGLKNMFMEEMKVFHIKDIRGFEVRTNGHSAANLGGAVVGGLIFGGIGAIIGGLSGKEKISNLSLIFKTDDFKNPNIEIKFLDDKVKKGSLVHKEIESKLIKITSLLEIIEKKYKA